MAHQDGSESESSLAPLPFEEPAADIVRETEATGPSVDATLQTQASGDGSRSPDGTPELSMMEQAEQLMERMAQVDPESKSPGTGGGETGGVAEGVATSAHAASPYTGALRLSYEERNQRQTSNVFRVIRQQMRGDRSLYGRKLADAQRVFALMDADGSGTMTTDEFSDALTRMGLGLTAVQVAEVLATVDADGSGTIEYDEFVALLGAELERPTSAPARVSRRRGRSSRRVPSAGVSRSRKVYSNRDALGFEDPPGLSDYRHVPVYQSCFPVYVNRVFQKAAPDLATSNRTPDSADENSLNELRSVPTDAINSKTLPATMYAQHAIDWPGGQIPQSRPASAASVRSAGSGRPPVGRRRPNSAASNLQRRSITMDKETKVKREVENVFRVISQQLRGKRTLYGEVMAEARDVFNLIDKDRSRTLDKTEFTTALQRMGLGLTEEQVEEVIAAVDKDGNGTIEYPEFVALLGAEWSRSGSAPPAKTRFGASQRPRSGHTRKSRASTAKHSVGVHRPGSAPVMDRYSAVKQYPNGWKPRPHKGVKDGQFVQHIPAVGNADTSYWGWHKTPGAPGHKTWIDDYKGGVVIEQLTPRRAAWNDQITREPPRSARPADSGRYRDTMTIDSMERPQSAPSRTVLRQEQRAKEIEASMASNAHFSRWRPRKATPKKASRRDISYSKDPEPVQQEIEVQTDLLAEYQDCPAIVLQVFAAGGLSMNASENEVFCRLNFGKHELQTPSLPARVPHPLPESMPICLFGKPNQPRSDHFVQVDCFGKAAGETRSVHCGSLRLDLTHPDASSSKLRFFKFARRDDREAPTPTSTKLRPFKSYGFGLQDEHMDFGSSGESHVGEWNEVFADSTGSPHHSVTPEGWLALKMNFAECAGRAEGATREALEKAAQQIAQEAANSLGRLSVTVCCGRRLPQEQQAQKLLDPICHVHYRKETVSTSVAFNTCTPVWDETFAFDVTDLNDELRLMVYDWKANAESCTLVGAAVLGICEELGHLNESERWVELYVLRPDKTLRRRGDVFCRLHFSPAKPAPPTASPRQDLLIGTSTLSICLGLECIEARGLLVQPGVKLCCIVSLVQPLHQTQSQTTHASYSKLGDRFMPHTQVDDTGECTVVWNNAVDLSLCEPTAVLRVDVAAMSENSRCKPEVLGGFIVPAAHLMPGHKKGEWFQLLDPVELDGPKTNSSAFVDFHKASHTHAAALYFDNEQPAYRARNFGNVEWRGGQKLGQAAMKVRSKVDVRYIERLSATSPRGSGPPGSILDENIVGSVSVSVIKATGLSKIRAPRGLKDPDPFVQVFHGSDQHTTTTVRRSRSPSWVSDAQKQQWFTFPVSTTRSIVQFKVCSKALVGPDILLGSLSIGLREMMASASKLGTELPDPSDPAAQAEHKLLGVSDLDRTKPGDRRRRKKLDENGTLRVAMHLQLRSLDGRPNMLPVTRRLRSVVLTGDFLSNDPRFEIIGEDEGSPETASRKSQPQMSRKIVSSDGSLMCLEVSVLECTALRYKYVGSAVRPRIRLRFEDPPPLPEYADGEVGADSGDVPASIAVKLTQERKHWLETNAEVLMVVLNMQCICRGNRARRDYRMKRKSLEIFSSAQAPCEFDDRPYRMHTNNFSQQLVCDVLHDEPGQLPISLGTVGIPVSSLTLPSITGEHWHFLAPRTQGNQWAKLERVATTLQARVRGKQQYEDFQRRCLEPIHVVFLLGGPGSGKTTLGERLAEELGLIHFSSGEMLRRALRQKENTHVASRIRIAMQEGIPVPNDIIMPLIRRAIARLRFHRGGGTILLDGVPVSETQRDLLEELPKDEFPRPVRVFHLVCNDDTMIRRSMNSTHSTSRWRTDNTEEVASSMAASFHKSGMKVVEHYEQQGLLTTIDTGDSASEDESYVALKSSLTEYMTDAGHWNAAGKDPTRAKFQKRPHTVASQVDDETPRLPALRLRISAHRTGIASASRTLIGVMRWRRTARQRAEAKAQAVEDVMGGKVAAPKLGVAGEDAELEAPVSGGLTVEV